MGDTLDRFEDVKTTLLSSVVDFLDSVSKKVRTFLIIGNHDYPNNSVFLSKIHPFTSLKFWGERMTVVDEIMIREVKGRLLCFAPYIATGRFKEALETEPLWADSCVVFCHQEFKGCKMGAITSIDGDEWELDYPKVVSGHIHDYQKPQENIVYVGSPMQHAFGDRDLKTISLLIWEDGSKSHHEERINLKLPRMEMAHIDANNVESYVADKNKILKIVIRGTVAENLAVKKLLLIKEWKDAGHKVVFKDVSIEKKDLDRVKVSAVSFREALGCAISGDPELEKIYLEIFNGEHGI